MKQIIYIQSFNMEVYYSVLKLLLSIVIVLIAYTQME